MINNDKIINIKNPKFEEFIREILDKPSEPITRSDVIKTRKLTKLANEGVVITRETPNSPAYCELMDALKTKCIGTGDDMLLSLYSTMNDDPVKYKQIFGLCYLLGAMNIYDIGCGRNMQIGYLTHYKGFSYIGVDRITWDMEIIQDGRKIAVRKNLEDYNPLFSGYKNFRFIYAEYPFTLYPPNHHIAIAVGWDWDDTALTAMKEDFDRILIQVDFRNIDHVRNFFSAYSQRVIKTYTWENYFTGQERGHIYLLATKHADDFVRLDESNYDYHNDAFYLDNMMDNYKR